jgi:serine/threonine protein kinase
VTPFYANGSLNDILKRERSGACTVLDATRKSKIVFGIVTGLAFLHSRGVIHRNVKPANILLDENFEPALSDFYISYLYTGQPNVDGLESVGTPLFMAPERDSEMASVVDFSLDVYSLSITLYSLFAEPRALDNRATLRSPSQLFHALSSGARFVWKPEIPGSYRSLIVRCWNGDPQIRPRCYELLEDFHESHEYILDGADTSSVLAYEEKVYWSFGPPRVGRRL